MGDLRYAFRTLRKSPLASLTIVFTVALGLGLVAAVFTLFNSLLFRVDAVPNVHEIFAVERPRTAEGKRVRLTRLDYEALRRETDVFTDVLATIPETDSRVDGRRTAGALVTGNFFQVLGVGAAQGRVITPADDDLRNPVIVLSDRGQTIHFRDQPAVGRSLLINGVRCEIVGVMPKGFRGLMVGAPDYWAPLSLVEQLQPVVAAQKTELDVDIIGRLRPRLPRDAALAQLIAWDSRRATGGVDRRGAAVTLEPRRGTIPQPLEAVAVFTPILFAFGLILLIGCANVASLLLARAVSRQKEIGIRLSLGASRATIVRQLLIESLILAFAAAVLGYAVSRAILEAIVWAVLTTMPPDIGDVRLFVPEGDWRVGLFLIAGAVAASALFGLAPALHATRLQLVQIMRGEIVPDARPSGTRNLLIGAQVMASALLLICSAIFLRSAFAASTQDPGIRISDTAVVPIGNEAFRRQVVDTVRQDPAVSAVAASHPDPVFGSRPAVAESTWTKSTAAYKFVSPEFFGVLGIDIVRGRPFSAAENHVNAAVVIVAASFAKQMWPEGDGLGEVLRLAPDPAAPPREGPSVPPPAGAFTVIGIARDVAGFVLAEDKPANVYVPTSAAEAGTILSVRVHGDPETARRALMQRLSAIDPNVGDVVTLRTIAGLATYFLQVAFWLTLVLGALALALTVSGLFSVLSYLVEQRTKEIGVRMALGATAADVGRLVLAQTVRPVGVGMTIGAGVAVALAVALLASPAAATVGALIRVLDPVAYGASLVVIVLACGLAASVPTLKAARIDPMTSLRHE